MKYELSIYEKGLLAKGLSFYLQPKYLNYTDYLVNLDLLYINFCNLGILSNEDLDCMKTRTKETALSSYWNYDNKAPQHLSKEELRKIKISLSRNLIKVILLWWNSVILLDKLIWKNQFTEWLKFGLYSHRRYKYWQYGKKACCLQYHIWGNKEIIKTSWY